MKPLNKIEILLKDLLHRTTRGSNKLSETLAENFDFFDEQIINILEGEYQRSKNDWRVICGCFSVIGKASKSYPRINNRFVRKSYPLLNRGLQDKRISVKRLAIISVLNIIKPSPGEEIDCSQRLEWRPTLSKAPRLPL